MAFLGIEILKQSHGQGGLQMFPHGVKGGLQLPHGGQGLQGQLDIQFPHGLLQGQ